MSENPTEALENLRARIAAKPQPPEPLHECGVCNDTGWMEVDEKGRGVVYRCRRGCQIPIKRRVA